MERQVVEPVDELVEIAAEIRNGGLWLHVDEESPEIAYTICDADP
jgi:nitrogen fixation/metabolism regulation signal transduction histidine kinase